MNADMERLAIRPADEDLIAEKVLYLCPADTIESLADKTRPSTDNFALFLAMNGNGVTDERILEGAKKLLSLGLACLCAWGPDCKRVHDLFDVAAQPINSQLSGEDVIMTTWHSDESLEEALWFFVCVEFVTRKFENTCKDWIIAPLSNAEWEKSTRRKIAQISMLTEDE